MATTAKIAKRNAEAEARINDSVSALAKHFGVEIETQNVRVRDLEARRTYRKESLADALERIANAAGTPTEASKELLPEDFPARELLQGADLTLPEVQKMSREDLLSIKGIGEKTADAILNYK